MDEADGIILSLCIALLGVITMVHTRQIAKLRQDVEFGLLAASIGRGSQPRETKEAG